MQRKLSENLISLMKYHQIGTIQLARAINIALSTLKNIRNGTHFNPTIDTLLPIARYFSVSLEELIEGDPLARKKRSSGKKVALRQPKAIPVLSWEEAVNWPRRKPDVLRYVFTEKACSERCFALHFEYDMDIFAAPGLFIVEPTSKPLHLNYVLLKKNGLAVPFVKKFIVDEELSFLKSITIANKLVPFDKKYRLLGVIIEYRQSIARSNIKNKIEATYFSKNTLTA